MSWHFSRPFRIRPNVNVIGFDDYLCDSRSCRTYIDGTMIYRDGATFLMRDPHISLVPSQS